MEGLIERRFAGHHYYVIARTRYLDDLLPEQLARGAEQLVILGAGYDSRPYRFADRLGGVQVFEVDHPATSAAKQAKVRDIFGDIPANVAYVAVDFTVDNFADKLLACGYRTTRPTVFLWEGVTPYLDLAAVDGVLGFVTASAPAGSAIVFDYILRSVVQGTCTLRGAANEFAKMSQHKRAAQFRDRRGPGARIPCLAGLPERGRRRGTRADKPLLRSARRTALHQTVVADHLRRSRRRRR